MRTRTAIAGAFFAALANGCVQVPRGPATSAAAAAAASNYQVKCEGSCLELKERAGLGVADFRRKFEDHVAAGRNLSAKNLVTRFPDLALATLRGRDKSKPATATELVLAAKVDELLQLPAVNGWTASLKSPASSALTGAELAVAETKQLLEAESWRHLRDRTGSMDVVGQRYPAAGVRIGLARAEAERRLGQAKAAQAAWQQAARCASKLGASWQDPTLWEQLATERPVEAVWPKDVLEALRPMAPAALEADLAKPNFPCASVTWHAIGVWHLQRGAPSLALAAFRKAAGPEAETTWNDFLQLQQARAWLALEQTPTAVSQLTALVDRPESPWRRSALALLGSAKLHDGHAQQAFAFLQEALNDAGDFPGRAEAEADFGLVLLELGRHAEGLKQLAAARTQFAQAGRHELVLLNVNNEIRYLDAVGQRDRAAAKRRELDQLQR